VRNLRTATTRPDIRSTSDCDEGRHQPGHRSEQSENGINQETVIRFSRLDQQAGQEDEMNRSLLAALVFFAGMVIVASAVLSPTGFAQQFQKQPLYRYQSARGHYLYTTSASLPKGASDGPWENEGIACHVPAPAAHGTKPVYQLAKSDDLGVRYAFTSSAAEANAGGGWINQGVVFHVANTKLTGTVPFYRLYKPLVPGQKTDTSVIGKIKDFLAGPEFTESTANVLQDTTFYTIDEGDKALALSHGFISQGILGYVWATAGNASSPIKPDLVVVKTDAADTSVTTVIRNQGTANTGMVSYLVSLLVYDSKDHFLYRMSQPGAGLSPNQSTQLTFDTGDKSLKGKRYQVKVDALNALTESDEDNNDTAILDGPLQPKIKPVTGEKTSIPLVLSMVGKVGTPIKIGKRDVTRIDYQLKITNTDAFPTDWYSNLSILPSINCSTQKTNARLLMEPSWKIDKDGKWEKAGAWIRGMCTPLTTPQQFNQITLTLNDDYEIPDHIKVTVRDRLTGIVHESNVVPVGAFGVAEAIHSLGCTKLLNRDDDFVCRKQVGFDACENLRKNGKSIKCKLVLPQ
jgi:hypothetical protein